MPNVGGVKRPVADIFPPKLRKDGFRLTADDRSQKEGEQQRLHGGQSNAGDGKGQAKINAFLFGTPRKGFDSPEG